MYIGLSSLLFEAKAHVLVILYSKLDGAHAWRMAGAQ